jgi:opacity protein-like surface antigen
MKCKIATALTGVVAINSLGADSLLPATTQPSNQTLNPAPAGIWEGEAEQGYRKGVNEVGVSLGASFGSSVLGSTEPHEFAQTKLHIGQVISDVVAKDSWCRGNWEFLGEGFGGVQCKPHSAYFVGLTPGLRYNFATGTRWQPFFDVGAGVTATDIGRPDLGGTFQFNLQAGPGVHWLLSKNTNLTLQYRFLHLSSASIEKPNHGVNTSVLYLGVGWFF